MRREPPKKSSKKNLVDLADLSIQEAGERILSRRGC